MKIIARATSPAVDALTGRVYRNLQPHPAADGKEPEIAVYHDLRYFALTGHIFANRGVIRDCQSGIDALYQQYWPAITSPLVLPASCRSQVGGGDGVVHPAALVAMRRATAQIVDGCDGSRRLLTCACRCIDFDLSDCDAIATIRAYADERPFPTAWSDAKILARLRDAEFRSVRGSALAIRNADCTREHFSQLILPGGDHTISETAGELGLLLVTQQSHFVRGGAVVCVASDQSNEPILHSVKPEQLASDMEHVARVVQFKIGKNGPEYAPAICKKATAELILAADAFKKRLPPLRILSRCPVLTERDGQLIEVAGYDPDSGVLAYGSSPLQITLEGAQQALNEVLDGFLFASPADRSRALAGVITPALVMGGLLPGRAPIDLGEADKSQAGKGYRNKVTAAIYRDVPRAVNQRKGGVGSLEEAFDRALIEGRPIISLDNIRGNVNSQAIESFMTEDSYSARSAYCPVTTIDPRRICVMLTSNKADLTADLANRCSCVRMLKQPDGYQFSLYLEGDLLAHVRANQPRFLGAVFAVVRAWHAAGKPRSAETRHDFRGWAQTLDWIVQELLDAPPLMDEHRETQHRMANPALNWLRDVALVVQRTGRAGQSLIAAELLAALAADGGVEIPGLGDGDVENASTRRAALQQIGRRMQQCFADRDAVTVDRHRVERVRYTDDQSRSRVRYTFGPAAAPYVPP